MIFTEFMVITTILDKVLGKKLKKKSSKTGQEKRILISAFLSVLNTMSKKMISLGEIGDTPTCAQIQLWYFPRFFSFREGLSLTFFSKLSDNSYRKWLYLDMKSHFTFRVSNLHRNKIKFQNLRAKIIVSILNNLAST